MLHFFRTYLSMVKHPLRGRMGTHESGSLRVISALYSRLYPPIVLNLICIDLRLNSMLSLMQ